MMDIRRLLQDRKDIAQETLADPNAELADKDEAGSEAANVCFALWGWCDGPNRG
jgi:hypothetical protein